MKKAPTRVSHASAKSRLQARRLRAEENPGVSGLNATRALHFSVFTLAFDAAAAAGGGGSITIAPCSSRLYFAFRLVY